jgi:hypothetical protein
MSIDQDNESENSSDSDAGYCHFNESGNETTFNIVLYGLDLEINQLPSSRNLGHGAVVWDSSGDKSL